MIMNALNALYSGNLNFADCHPATIKKLTKILLIRDIPNIEKKTIPQH